MQKRRSSTINRQKVDNAFSGGTSNNQKVDFSVPADFSCDSVPALAETRAIGKGKGIVEVYGNLNPSPLFLGSGRNKKFIPRVQFTELKKYVVDLRYAGIEFNYTLNSSCLSNREYTESFAAQLVDFIKTLRDIGIRRFTIALPSLLDHVCKIEDVSITISTIAGITSPFGMRFVEQFRNVDRLCVPESLNRNLKKFGALAANTRLSLETIVNSLCLLSCAFRHQHYDFNAHADILPDESYHREYYGVICDIERIDRPAHLLSSPWIRPEDIDLYVDIGVSLFKISGREIPDADIVRTVKCYQQRYSNGNLMELFGCFGENPYLKIFNLDSKDIAEVIPIILARDSGCHELLCSSCGICEKWTRQHTILKNDISKIRAMLMEKLYGKR